MSCTQRGRERGGTEGASARRPGPCMCTAPGRAPPRQHPHDATARSLPRPPGWNALQRGHLRGLSASPPSPNRWAGADTLLTAMPTRFACSARTTTPPPRRFRRQPRTFLSTHAHCTPGRCATLRERPAPPRHGLWAPGPAHTTPRPPTLPPCTLNCGTTTTPPAQASASFEMLEVSEAAKAVTGASAATLHKRRRTLDSQGVDAAAKWGQVS